MYLCKSCTCGRLLIIKVKTTGGKKEKKQTNNGRQTVSKEIR